MSRQDPPDRLLLKNGRVIDPTADVDDLLDVLIENGAVARVERGIAASSADRVVECDSLVVAPGFVDMHVHLREPGREDKETIETGGLAAAAGGFTAVACMPNTVPVNDDQSVTEFILAQARRGSPVRVHPIGAITKGQKGEELSEIAELVRVGCVAISDDGRPVSNGFIMRKALEYAKMFDIPVINHAQDLALANGGVMNEGFYSTVLGLRGMNAAAEESMIHRDILLAELTGGRLHIPHISTARSLELVRRAKERGVRVTCEAAPHHFTLTDEAVCGYDTSTKMNPPLRAESDRDAVVQALFDGTIDAVASDHAPHCQEEKDVEYDLAPFGIVGLETSVPLGLDRLVAEAGLDLKQFVRLYSSGPARILGLAAGTLRPGSPADVTVFSTSSETTVDPCAFRSKSRNTPFTGWTLKGAVVLTIVGGGIVFDPLGRGGSRQAPRRGGGRAGGNRISL
ncbi:MAG TPA: dihydroorotase [Candidatus Polarisedimenticolia bacterium]|nr:dihydroorotase [Candidatus Polarisedimenticolia bacterium]